MVLAVPSVQYFAAIACMPDDAAVQRSLRDYHEMGAGPFGYDPFRNTLVDFLAKRCSQADAVQYCESHGAKAGRRQNADAVRLVFPYLSGRIGFSRKLRREVFAFRRDLEVSVGPLVLTRDEDIPVLVTTQPRKTWAMTDDAWRLWATIISEVHAGDDAAFLFDGMDEIATDIEILDLSAPLGMNRTIVSHRFNPENLMRPVEFAAALQRFANAHDTLVAAGFTGRPASRPQKSDTADLFDVPQDD